MSFAGRSSIAMCILVPLLLSPAGAAAAAPEKSGADDEHRRPDPDERVCRTLQVTGSHIPRRVCMKQRKWDEMREQAQRAMQNSHGGASPGGEGPH